MSLETEIMTTQRNVERLNVEDLTPRHFRRWGGHGAHTRKKNVEDLTEAAIQKCFLKWVFFKAIRILKTACVYIHFKKKLQVKSLQLSQK